MAGRVQSRKLAVALGVVAALGLTSCGDRIDPAAQPHTGGERFEDIRFSDLPRPIGEYGDLEDVKLVETQSVEIADTNPENVLRFYHERLAADGWAVVEGIKPKNESEWYGTWERWGHQVVVVAAPGEETDDGTPAPTVATVSMKRPAN
ncbi:MAG: hypothetical protein ACKVWR_00815 [Acidimicrobiales bacterium]